MLVIDVEHLFMQLIQVLETLDAVLDVGGLYDPATDRYDHHQRGFDHNFGNGFVTKLSSAGLVYKVEFGFSCTPSLALTYRILLSPSLHRRQTLLGVKLLV